MHINVYISGKHSVRFNKRNIDDNSCVQMKNQKHTYTFYELASLFLLFVVANMKTLEIKLQSKVYRENIQQKISYFNLRLILIERFK